MNVHKVIECQTIVIVYCVKMSYWLGNFIIGDDLREKFDGNVIRLAMLKTHYRAPIDLTETLFNESIKINDKVKNVLKNANIYLQINNIN